MGFKLITEELITTMAAAAKNSSRRRSLYTFHEANTDKVHRLLNIIQPDSYLRPHKHTTPDKVEVVVLLKGELAVVEFAEDGRVMTNIVLSAGQAPYVLEIEPNTWHTFIALESDTAVYLVTEGPWYPASHKVLADWSPEETDIAGAEKYLAGLRQELMLY